MKVSSQTVCQTKNNVTECAFKLFSHQGFNKVTIAQICQSAHITRTAFYYYFNCKEELLDYFFVYSAVPIPFTRAFSNELAAIPKNTHKLLAILNKYLDRCIQAGPNLTAVFLNKYLSCALPKLSPKGLPFYGTMVELMKRAAAAGEIRIKSGFERLLESFLYAVIGMLMQWCAEKGNFNLAAKVKQCFDITFCSLP